MTNELEDRVVSFPSVDYTLLAAFLLGCALAVLWRMWHVHNRRQGERAELEQAHRAWLDELFADPDEPDVP